MKTLLILSAVLSGLLAVTAAAAVGAAEVAPEELVKDSPVAEVAPEELLKDSPVAVEEVAVAVVEEEQPEMMSPEEEASSPEGRFSFCPPGWEKHKDGCYVYVSAPATWTNAADNCASVGGSLAPARDLFEYDFLQDLTQRASDTTAWIGGFHLMGWRWADHSPFGYTNWNSHASATSNQCIYLNSFAGWSNGYCGARRTYICRKKIGAC